MDLLVTDFMGARAYIDVAVVSPAVVAAYHLASAAKKPGYAALRAEYGKRQRYPVNNIIPFVLELGGRPGPTAIRFIRDLFKLEGSSREQNIADVWTTISAALQTSIGEQLHKVHISPTAPHHTAPTPPHQPAPTQHDTQSQALAATPPSQPAAQPPTGAAGAPAIA